MSGPKNVLSSMVRYPVFSYLARSTATFCLRSILEASVAEERAGDLSQSLSQWRGHTKRSTRLRVRSSRCLSYSPGAPSGSTGAILCRCGRDTTEVQLPRGLDAPGDARLGCHGDAVNQRLSR